MQWYYSKMKDFHGCLLSLISLWIHLSRNQVLAIDIPASFLNFESSSAGPLNAPDLEDSVRNATSIGGVDPAFDFAPIYLGGKLRPIPCLLNSVNVALQLALEDFEGLLFETVYRLDSHPQVEIAVIPDEEGGSIPRKFAVWGLNIGIGVSFWSPSFLFGLPGVLLSCLVQRRRCFRTFSFSYAFSSDTAGVTSFR